MKYKWFVSFSCVFFRSWIRTDERSSCATGHPCTAWCGACLFQFCEMLKKMGQMMMMRIFCMKSEWCLPHLLLHLFMALPLLCIHEFENPCNPLCCFFKAWLAGTGLHPIFRMCQLLLNSPANLIACRITMFEWEFMSVWFLVLLAVNLYCFVSVCVSSLSVK